MFVHYAVLTTMKTSFTFFKFSSYFSAMYSLKQYLFCYKQLTKFNSIPFDHILNRSLSRNLLKP